MVEVKESTYKETISTQLHFILGIWSALKVFTDFYSILSFLTFMGDLTFVKILNVGIRRRWEESVIYLGEFRYPYSYSSHTKGFISANMQGSAL